MKSTFHPFQAAHSVEQGFLHAEGAPQWSMMTQEWSQQWDDLAHFAKFSPWSLFTAVFFTLVVLDNIVLQRMLRKSISGALCYASFWVLCAVGFCLYIRITRGQEAAMSWGVGYLLEWMLSFDNLFIFQRIFSIFATPQSQKHKPLFIGILGAACIRMQILFGGQALLNSAVWMSNLFGAFLVYSGVMALRSVEDEGKNAWHLQPMTGLFNYIDMYHSKKAFFFMRVPISKKTGEVVASGILTNNEFNGCAPKSPALALQASPARNPSMLPAPIKKMAGKNPDEDFSYEWRGTRLLLVLLLLEVTNLVFAVDSMTAIVTQVPDLFISSTACIFAMLGLRASFFVLDELAKFFTFLDYGIAATLILTGARLLLKNWIHVSQKLVCCTIAGIFVVSILASFIYETCKRSHDQPMVFQQAPADRNKKLRRRSLSVDIDGCLISARRPMTSQSLVSDRLKKNMSTLSPLGY